MFKGKPVRVVLAKEAQEEFELLNKEVGEETAEGITKSDNILLLRSLRQKIDLIKENPNFGTQIPKDRIPKEYKWNYDANNLWKVDLTGAWRMIYTLRGNEVEIVALILDIFNHRDYEKKFGYRKS